MFLEVPRWAERGFEHIPLTAVPILTPALLTFGLGDIPYENAILVRVGEFGSGTDVGVERIVGIVENPNSIGCLFWGGQVNMLLGARIFFLQIEMKVGFLSPSLDSIHTSGFLQANIWSLRDHLQEDGLVRRELMIGVFKGVWFLMMTVVINVHSKQYVRKVTNFPGEFV